MTTVSVLNESFTDINNFLDKGVTGLDAVLLAAGWERSTLGEQIASGNDAQDRVYYSPGEDGFQALYLRVTHDSANERVHFRSYSYWAPGAPGAGYNVAGNVAGDTCVQLVAGAMQGWIVATGDGVAIVADIDGGTTYNKGYFGALEQTLPSQRAFYGRLAGPATGTNQTGALTLQFQAGTSFTNLESGQYLWVVNLSATGPANVERVQVDSIDIPNLQVDILVALVEDYAINAIVAVDPQPVVLWGNSGGTLAGATPYALHDVDAYTGVLTHSVGWTSLLDSIGATLLPATDYGDIPLADLWFYVTAAASRSSKGELSRFRRAPTGTVVALDDVTVGTVIHRIFPDSTGFIALRES